MKKAIFLDRDGVINESFVIDGKPFPPRKIKELKIIESSIEAVKLFKQHFFVFIITNQPDVARGLMHIDDLTAINNKIKELFNVDEIFSCIHDDKDLCLCRKPMPGMILSAAEKYNIDLTQSFVVGDRWKDIEAGIKSGCKTVFIDYNYSEKKPQKYNYKVKTLLEFAHILLDKNEIR